MNPKTIIRKAKNKENPYAQIAKTAVQDKRLSWKATGLLAYILSLPDDWQIYATDLAKRKHDGISATRTALKELADTGYIELVSTRDDQGRYIRHEHIVHENPITTIQNTESGFLDTTNTHVTKDGLLDDVCFISDCEIQEPGSLRYDHDRQYREMLDNA